MSVQTMCSGEAALVPGGLRGYRMWNQRGALLTAVSQRVDWTVPTLDATCESGSYHLSFTFNNKPVADGRKPHVVPDELCGCGIYGWYRPDEVRLHQGAIFGAVEATGRVLLGDFGFRAEHARIVAIVSDYEPLQFYWTHRGVPVFETREALLAEYPPQDVRELIGHEIPDTPPDADMWGTFTVSMNTTHFSQVLQRAMRDAHISFSTTAASAGRASAAFKEALDELSEDPMERALALRKQGTRGPVKRRRGRARLELDL